MANILEKSVHNLRVGESLILNSEKVPEEPIFPVDCNPPEKFPYPPFFDYGVDIDSLKNSGIEVTETVTRSPPPGYCGGSTYFFYTFTFPVKGQFNFHINTLSSYGEEKNKSNFIEVNVN